MKEVFCIIKDYLNYSVSNLGNVRNDKTGRILKPGNSGDGYFTVALCKNGEVKHFRVHRLVAQAFIPNPLGLPEVNHIDEDKLNNRAENLEWCSRQYNQEYSLSKQVAQYDLSGNLIATWKSLMEITRQLGFNGSAISKCCLGKLRQSYGYIWKYV